MLLRKENRWLLIDENSDLSISEQCKALALPRSTYYWKKSHSDDKEAERKREKAEHDQYCQIVMEEWTKFPAYGYRKMGFHLRGMEMAGQLSMQSERYTRN